MIPGDEYPGGIIDRDAAPIGSRVLYSDAVMKQAQSGTSSSMAAGRWGSAGSGSPRPSSWRRRRPTAKYGGTGDSAARAVGRTVLALFAAAWFLVTAPFRLVFWVIALLGRVTGIAIGFGLMVAGMFFLAGPLFLIGIPLFLIGLVLTLRCLE
jgi:hypothetical protein